MSAGLHIHFDVGHGGSVGNQVSAQPRAASAAQSAAAEAAGHTRGIPLRCIGHGIKHAAPALVLHVATSQFHRIDRELHRELVDGLFRNKRKGQVEG